MTPKKKPRLCSSGGLGQSLPCQSIRCGGGNQDAGEATLPAPSVEEPDFWILLAFLVIFGLTERPLRGDF